MLCGYLKQVCKSITVEELINILQTCKNKNAVVKLSETTNFFVHFDQEGQYIDFSKSPLGNQYGNTLGQTCKSCGRFDGKDCKCDGKGCLNAESIVDTEKLDEARISLEPSHEDSRNQAPTAPIQKENVTITNTDKYDISKYAINGSSFETENKIENDTPKRKFISEHEAGQLMAKNIQDAVDKAILNTLDRMITGIKGDK